MILMLKYSGVIAVVFKQLFMGSPFRDPSVIQYQYLIGILQRGYTVRDDEDGMVAFQVFQLCM